MEIHPSLWTYFLGEMLGVENPHQLVFIDHIISAGLTFIFLTVFALILKSRLSPIPGGVQQLMEVFISALNGLLEDNMGEEGKHYLPLIATFALFIFISNIMGMIPGHTSATGNLNTTVGCSLIVFVYYHFQGIKKHGLGYIKQFTGPYWWLTPLLLPIEIIHHCARPFSLSMRLFMNIAGEHVVVAVIVSLAPWIVPIPLLALGLIAATIQTFIFVMLTTLYIAGARSHPH